MHKLLAVLLVGLFLLPTVSFAKSSTSSTSEAKEQITTIKQQIKKLQKELFSLEKTLKTSKQSKKQAKKDSTKTRESRSDTRTEEVLPKVSLGDQFCRGDIMYQEFSTSNDDWSTGIAEIYPVDISEEAAAYTDWLKVSVNPGMNRMSLPGTRTEGSYKYKVTLYQGTGGAVSKNRVVQETGTTVLDINCK